MGVTFVDRIYQRNNLSIVHHFSFNVSALPEDERLEQVGDLFFLTKIVFYVFYVESNRLIKSLHKCFINSV